MLHNPPYANPVTPGVAPLILQRPDNLAQAFRAQAEVMKKNKKNKKKKK